MKLRGIEFGNVFGASGVEGFFGEGYWFHKPGKLLDTLSFKGMTFVSKTATLQARSGNMPLRENYTPKEWFPKCIVALPKKGAMLNAVGLSNPGIVPLLNAMRWQAFKAPIGISIMAVGPVHEQVEEIKLIAHQINQHFSGFRVPVFIQDNESCPSTGHDQKEMHRYVRAKISALASTGLPVMVKFSAAEAPIELLLELDQDPNCDAICISNTIPYDWIPPGEKISLGEQVFGTKQSPLLKYKNEKGESLFPAGGILGRPIKPFSIAKVKEARAAGFRKPINGCGGIFTPQDVIDYRDAGASSVSIGSGATLMSLMPLPIIPHVIQTANSLNWGN